MYIPTTFQEPFLTTSFPDPLYVMSYCKPLRTYGSGYETNSLQESGEGGADTFVWHKENTLSLIINGYSFDQGGCSSTSQVHTRLMSFLIVFIL